MPLSNLVPSLATSELASIFEHMLNGIAYCEVVYENGVATDWVYRYTNPAFHAQTGMGPVQGRRVSEIIPGIHAADPGLLAMYSAVAAGGPPGKVEVFVDALQHWFEVSCFSPRPGAFVAAFDVITERKRKEVALQEAQERLAQAELAARAGIWDWNLQTNEVVWSDGFCRMFGHTARQGPPGLNTWRHMVHPDDLPMAAAEVLAAAGSGQPRYFNQYRIVRPDGQHRWISSYGQTKLDAQGKPLRMSGICVDVTEQKLVALELDRYRHHLEELVQDRTQALTLAKDAAEAASVAKTAFLANMSHEIRTPMNAIVGMAHLVRRGELNDHQAAQVDEIISAADHLLTVISDVLDVSKIEAGMLELESVDVSIPELMHKVTVITAEQVRAKGLKMVVDTQHLPLHLKGDPTRLSQALLNYANNAVKFTERGTVTIRNRLVDEDETTKLIRFEVQDTGIGIAPEQAQRLFTAFEQADNSTTRQYGGTGLGLAITRRLAGLMGGEAGVTSAPGVGSTFWFTARLAKGASHPADNASPSPADTPEALLARHHRGKKLLLAEDERANQMVAMGFLEVCGLEPDVANNGEEAVAMARTGGYDLILMDMQMPRMDGLEATRRIRQFPGCQTVPIIAMTGNAFSEDRARCLREGMNDFLPKPFRPAHLYDKILHWLSQPRP